jgi:hypothetical protein
MREEMFISQTTPQHMDVDVNVVSLRDDKNVILPAIDLSWLCQLQLNQISSNTAAVIFHRGIDHDDDNMSFNSLPLNSGGWSQTIKSDRSTHGLPVSGSSGSSAYFSETQNAGESILSEVCRSLVRLLLTDKKKHTMAMRTHKGLTQTIPPRKRSRNLHTNRHCSNNPGFPA